MKNALLGAASISIFLVIETFSAARGGRMVRAPAKPWRAIRAKLTGGVGLLIPSLSGLAALELTAVMLGAVGTHLFFQPPAYFAVMPGTIGVLLVLVARARKSEIKSALAAFLG